MYTRFFGLEQKPFSIAPDPKFLFMSEKHREALAHLLYGLGGSGGFVLLTGEIGAGKTTVSRCLLEQIPAACNVAYIFNPKLTVNELLQSVCDEFRVAYAQPHPGVATVKNYLDPLNEYLLATHARGQSSMLIIDEAQSLSSDVLEQLRLLTNLETNERKLLQIVLIGQPDLRTVLARPGLEQLAQRVIARFHLEALSEIETANYIAHRLAVAGMTGPMPFDQKALRRIYRLSRGVPRRINLLCDRAMLGAYASGKPTVTGSIIDKAAGEVFDRGEFAATGRGRSQRIALVGIAAAATLVGVAIVSIDSGLLKSSLDIRESSAKVPTLAAAPAGAAVSTRAPSKTGSAAALPAALSTPANLNFSSLTRAESDAWRELAPLWNLDLGHADPCRTAPLRGVHCFRGRGDLALLRQLDRPCILTVRDQGNRLAYVLLSGLTSRAASLRVAGVTTNLPLDVLAQMWQGRFATFWRVPPGYRDRLGVKESDQMANWVGAQLSALEGRPKLMPAVKVALKSRIHAFQLAYGLTPDGIAGPITLMQLNRTTGANEPHLRAGI